MSESLTPDQQAPNTDTADAPQEDANAQPEMSLEDALRELGKVRKEAAKSRTKLREREEAEKAALEAKQKAEMTAEERAKQAEQRAQEALEAAEARVLTAERKAALAGKVANPDRVLRLMDDQESFFDGSTPDVDAILTAFPEYAPQAAGPGAVRAPGAPLAGTARHLTLDDLARMTPDEINANWHLLKK